MSRAVVIGSGPNGLSAAVVLARAGMDVEVVEAADDAGGGLRTRELTVPGFRHDVCSAIHPMAITSPFFRAFQLQRRVEYLAADISYAQSISPSRAAVAYRDIERTAERLGPDAAAYRSLLGPLSERIDDVAELSMNSLLRLPRHPVTAARFGARVLEQAGPWWRGRFGSEDAPSLLAGVAAHAISRLPSLSGAAVGLALAAHAHAPGGWPAPRGGASAVAGAMIDDLLAHGGRVTVGRRVDDLAEFADAEVVIADTSARELVRLAGERLPDRYAAALRRFRYGNAVAKIDVALDGPVPWTRPELAAAPTVHLGCSWRETLHAENEVAAGRYPDTPYVLIAQPSVVDDSRAPAGGHVLWAYTHVPSGSTRDMREAILDRIESHAPGLRQRVLGVHATTAADEEALNANYVGGDISSGAATIAQLLARPVLSPQPWRTPAAGLYLASSSAVPGPGIHGMGGYLAARTALADRGVAVPELGLH
ncbi:phytoene desaturase family protein [Mycetocola reblochoni]|uniref:phytoene desaturase family protein n=1 Tax=Mycetocola reblochoni TaxID=331618 RepID=UPI003F96FDBC